MAGRPCRHCRRKPLKPSSSAIQGNPPQSSGLAEQMIALKTAKIIK
jgi:hypothetical protein